MDVPDEVVERVRRLMGEIQEHNLPGTRAWQNSATVLALLPAPPAKPLPCPFCGAEADVSGLGLQEEHYNQWVMCGDGKQPYATFGQAERVLARMARRHRIGQRSDLRRISIYRCPACGSYHVGGSMGRREREGAR